jgi:hypothetical protein
MSEKITCGFRRPKPARYLSARNVDGRSWQKCGRAAVARIVISPNTPICRQCLVEYPGKIKSL